MANRPTDLCQSPHFGVFHHSPFGGLWYCFITLNSAQDRPGAPFQTFHKTHSPKALLLADFWESSHTGIIGVFLRGTAKTIPSNSFTSPETAG